MPSQTGYMQCPALLRPRL